MRTSRVVMLIVGLVLTLVALAVLAGGALLGVAYVTQRDDDGFFTTPTERYETDTHALVSEALELTDTDDLPSFLGPEDFGRLLVRGESADPAGALFVGIGPEADVDRYLEGVGHAVVTDIEFGTFDASYDTRPGGPPASPPTEQGFWAVSAAGEGRQEITWDISDGRWSIVVMNADGSAPVAADLEAGGRFDILGPIAIGLLVFGVVLLAIAVVLLVIAISGLRRREQPPAAPPGAPVTGPGAPAWSAPAPPAAPPQPGPAPPSSAGPAPPPPSSSGAPAAPPPSTAPPQPSPAAPPPGSEGAPQR